MIATGAASLSACTSGSVSIAPDTSASSETVTSNGGFVTATNDYYYFINGVESHTADNTYGKVVKGALMRQKKSSLVNKTNDSEIVVPLLITPDPSTTGGTGGIYIYGKEGDARVYYASPNNVKNTSGVIENDYLDFKSTSLDGKNTKSYFRVSSVSTTYRFVEIDNTVYVLYVDNSDLHSYNTTTGTDTLLASSMKEYVLNSFDKDDPYVYYTMGVTAWVDSNNPKEMGYNQIYRVRADVTEAPYEYKFNEEWVKDSNDGKEPYHNFGTIVLDGVGQTSVIEGVGEANVTAATRFSPDYTTKDELPLYAYTYTLQSYTNGGIYFTRSLVNSSTSELYYLDCDLLEEGWSSIRGNSVYRTGNTEGKLEVVANSVNAANAGTAAIFYIDKNGADHTKHHYIYVKDNSIYRADVLNDGSGLNVQYSSSGDLRIALNESGATLVSIDDSDSTYHYVYFTKSSGSGNSVDRVPYNGTEENYSNLSSAGESNDAFKSATVAGVQHASSWYNYEIVDNILFYANAESIGSTSYNYIYTVDLKNSDGDLMDNTELKAVKDNYDLMTGDEGYIAEVSKDHSDLATPIRYYFYTGKSEQFFKNIQDAVDLGKKKTHLYSEEEQDIFKKFVEGVDNDFVPELNNEGAKYRVQSAFITFIGQKSKTDVESEANYWETAIKNYQPPETEGGLAWWAWLLIALAIAAVVAGATVTTVLLVLRKKKNATKEPVKKLEVDTSDDRDIDVYATNDGNLEEAANADAEESAEPAEAAEEATEPTEAVEESAETTEAPAEDAPATEEPEAETPATESPADTDNKTEE